MNVSFEGLAGVLLEITCLQQLLTECALLLGHTLASERTGHNSVSDHLYYSEDCLTRRGLDQCILLLVLVYYSSVIKLLLLLICWFLSFLLLLFIVTHSCYFWHVTHGIYKSNVPLLTKKTSFEVKHCKIETVLISMSARAAKLKKTYN